MITPQEWQRRALDLDREGLEVTVVGRAGRLSERKISEPSSSTVKAEAGLALTITLNKILMATGAVTVLCHLLEHVLQDAAGRAKASKREELTAEDIEEAWKRQKSAS
jgi:hypothetical protein